MSFLPQNSTDWERSVEEAMDEKSIIRPALVEIRGVKYARPLNASVAPWLIQEYGLGPISQFFDTYEEVIDQGRPWQRIRGTPAAVTTAMGWIDYDDITILDQVPSRRRWHLYQADMGELPLPDEDTRLANAEYLANISDSSRNYFWRGFYGYDVRVHVWGRSRYGRSIWGDSSGVRINGGRVKWSHGRPHAITITPTPDEFEDLGVDFTTGEQLTWEAEITWDTPGVTWAGVSSAAEMKAWALQDLDVYLGLYNGSGNPIGYIKNLMPAISTVTSGDVDLNYDIRTGFGDSDDTVVHSVSIIFGGRNKATVKPYRRFVLPSQIEFPDGEIRVGSFAVDVVFQRTIREFFKVALRIED